MDLFYGSLLSLFVIFISLSLHFLFYKKNPTTARHPPGRTGWPFLGETLEFLSTGWNGRPEKFVFDHIAKFAGPFDRLVSGIFSIPIDFPGTQFNKAIKASKHIRKELTEITKKRKIDLEEGKASPKQDVLSHMLVTNGDDEDARTDSDIANYTCTSVVRYLGELPKIHGVYKGPALLISDMTLNNEPSRLEALPQHIQGLIAAFLAKDSVQALFSFKLSSPDLRMAAESSQVLQLVNLDKVHIDPFLGLKPPTSRFIMNCYNANNPNAYYFLGMRQFFRIRDMNLGFDYLHDANLRGHMEATYVIGMLILSRSSAPLHDEGITLLNKFKRANPTWDIPLSRKKVQVRFSQLWTYREHINRFVWRCRKPLHTIEHIRQLDYKEDTEILSCDRCFWYREYLLYCRMFDVYL